MSWQVVEGISVAGTGLVVLWYTWETHKLRKLSERQIESLKDQEDVSKQQTAIARQQAHTADRQATISEKQSQLFVQQMESAIRPFVVLFVKEDEHWVKNWGTGPALDVNVDDVLFDPGLSISIEFLERISLLGPGEEVPIRAQQTLEGEDVDLTMLKVVLDERFIESRQVVVLHYKNMEGKEYASKQWYWTGLKLLSGVYEVESFTDDE